MTITGGRSAMFIIAAGVAVGSAGTAWAAGRPAPYRVN